MLVEHRSINFGGANVCQHSKPKPVKHMYIVVKTLASAVEIKFHWLAQMHIEFILDFP